MPSVRSNFKSDVKCRTTTSNWGSRSADAATSSEVCACRSSSNSSLGATRSAASDGVASVSTVGTDSLHTREVNSTVEASSPSRIPELRRETLGTLKHDLMPFVRSNFRSRMICRTTTSLCGSTDYSSLGVRDLRSSADALTSCDGCACRAARPTGLVLVLRGATAPAASDGVAFDLRK